MAPFAAVAAAVIAIQEFFRSTDGQFCAVLVKLLEPNLLVQGQNPSTTTGNPRVDVAWCVDGNCV
jgi:hypothetical protein